MTYAEFEPAIPAIKWPQTYTSDGSAIGVGEFSIYVKYNVLFWGANNVEF